MAVPQELTPCNAPVCSGDVNDREELLAGIKAKGIVHGDFELSSGGHATSYVDLRRVTLDGRLAPLVGRVLLNATADLSYDAVGGLTLGADPVAAAMMHAAASRGTPIDAFVVRKAEQGARPAAADRGTRRARAAGCSRSRTPRRPATPCSPPWTR